MVVLDALALRGTADSSETIARLVSSSRFRKGSRRHGQAILERHGIVTLGGRLDCADITVCREPAKAQHPTVVRVRLDRHPSTGVAE